MTRSTLMGLQMKSEKQENPQEEEENLIPRTHNKKISIH
jgi:hypothetical protein